MSFELLIRAWEDTHTSGANRIVLFILATMANDQGLCWPGYDHIARRANVDRVTAIKAVAWLEEHGFLIKTRRSDRGLRHKSNLYRVCLPEEMQVEEPPGEGVPNCQPGSPDPTDGASSGNQDSCVTQPGMVAPGNQDSCAAQPGIVAPGNQDGCVAQPESTLNHHLNKQVNQQQPVGAAPENIFQLYEQNIGMLTPLMAERLKDAERTYPYEWIEAAIKQCVYYNRRHWSYCESILRRYQVDGFRPTGQPKRAPLFKQSDDEFAAALKKWADS